jgi:uncharacterized cofD-like protein
MKHHDIVTIGNGSGSGVVLRALRKIADLERVTALVGVTDNGGHSGAVRVTLKIPSPGDVKTVIAALTGEDVWGQLFRHRFSEAQLKGVSMGNLILAALVDEGGSLYHATRRLTHALGIPAHIVPISDTDAQVVAILSDGSEVVGEWETINRANRDAVIVDIRHEPELETRPEALKALEAAKWIIICPGTLWLGTRSIVAAPGVSDTISKSSATIVVVGNLLTHPGVTDGMTARDHVVVIEDMLGREVDYYLQHDREIPQELLAAYLARGFEPTKDDLDGSAEWVIKDDLVSKHFLAKGDRAHYDPSRGYPHTIRHDPSALAKVFLEIADKIPGNEKFAMRPRDNRWEVMDF